MTAVQVGWICYGGGLLLFATGVAFLVGLLVTRHTGVDDHPTYGEAPGPTIVLPEEEPSGQHAITASTAPRSQASCYVDTGRISTAELAVLLAAPDGGEP